MYSPSSYRTFNITVIFAVIAIKNIKSMHAVSTNQISDVLHFNDRHYYQDDCKSANAFQKYDNWNLNDFDFTLLLSRRINNEFFSHFQASVYFYHSSTVFLWLYVYIAGHEIWRLQGIWKRSSYKGKQIFKRW